MFPNLVGQRITAAVLPLHTSLLLGVSNASFESYLSLLELTAAHSSKDGLRR